MPANVFADYTGINTGGITIGSTTADESSKDVTEKIVGTLQTIGSIISVVAIIIIGIRYMVSSVEEKSQMKGVIGYYVTGCILVFATSNILAIAYKIIHNL